MRIHRMKTHAFITSVSVDEGIKANKKQIVYPQSSCPCSGRSHHFEFIRVFIYFLWASHFRGQLYIPFERWTICLGFSMQCIDFTLSLDLSMGWFQIVCNGSQWTIWYKFGEKKINNVAKQYIVSVLENRTGFLQLFLSGLFIQIIGWGWRSGQPLIHITDRLFLDSSKCHRRLASLPKLRR